MKRYILIITATAALLGACSSPEAVPGGQSERKALEITLDPMARASVDYNAADYFVFADYMEAEVTLTSDALTWIENYVYGSGKLAAPSESRTIWFPYTGKSDVSVLWPVPALRKDIPFDQSDRMDFLLADWLRADLVNVDPVSLLAVNLKHERSKITFTVIGARQGSKIAYLEMGDYVAYCDPTAGIVDAQLIIPKDFQFDAEVSGYLYFDGEDDVYTYVLDNAPVVDPARSGNYTISITIN